MVKFKFKLAVPKKKILIIAGLVILIGGVGFGGFTLGQKKKPTAGPTEKTAEEEIVDDATKSAAKEGESEAGKEGQEGEAKEGQAKEGQKGEARKKGPPTKKELTFEFDRDFTVNLLDPKGRWFIKVVIKIEAGSLKARKQIEENVDPLRDDTIMLLSSKRREEVQTPEDWERLRRELLARYEGRLDRDAIKSIYFTERAIMSR